MDGIGGLRMSGVKPLRNPINRDMEERRNNTAVASFSVDYLKNGGSMNVSAGGQGAESAAGQGAPLAAIEAPAAESREIDLRERYVGRRAPGAGKNKNSNLTEAEQIEQLQKIKTSATDYEGVFMDQLVKAMRQKPLEKTAGGDTFSDIAEQPFRAFLAQSGGLGLADQIVGQVARQEGLEQTLHNNPDIMGPGWRPTVPQSHMKEPPAGLAKVDDFSRIVENKEASGASPENCGPADAPANEADDASETIVGLMSDEEIAYLYADAGAA